MEGKIHIPPGVSFSTSDHHSLPPSPTASHSSSTWDSSLVSENTLAQYKPDDSGEPSLESTLEGLTINESSSLQMFASIGVIFRHAITQEKADLGIANWQARLEQAELSSQRGIKDVDALRLIRTILDYLWSSGSEEDLVSAAKILADGCREPGWRIPFGTAGILAFFLEVIATPDVDPNMRSQTLRLIGNACADTDSNRESVVLDGFLPSIIKELQDNALAKLAIPVLYNICVDYEPAQEAVRSNSLCPEIISLLARDSFESHHLLSYICSLLNYSIQEFDVNLCPDNSVQVLLQIASNPEIEIEDLVSLVNAIVTHLKLERFQRLLITRDLVNIPLFMIIRSFSPQASSSASLSVTDLMPLVRDPEEEEQLSAIRSALIRALSDVSAIPEFAIQYPIDSSLIESLLRWLSASRAQFQICSSIMLGNLARSDHVCHSMVHELHVHEILAITVRDSSDLHVLHSTIGFLRNLALPMENKEVLGKAQVMKVISRFWSMDSSPQLQYGAVGLTRQLLNGSLPNVQRILTPLSPDPDSPAHEKTYLSILLSLFEKTDQMPTKLEIARTIASIWRCLNTPNKSVDSKFLSDTINRLLSIHKDVGMPLAMMVSQSRWPVILSEGWFALALMARSQQGSAAVNEILQQIEVFGSLVETITGQPIAVTTGAAGTDAKSDPNMLIPRSDGTGMSPDQEAGMKVRNRENALVLINELLKNSGDGMSNIRRTGLEDLLRGHQPQLWIEELMLRAQSLE